MGLGDAAQCCHSPPGQPLAGGWGDSVPDLALIAVLPAGCVFSQLIPALFVRCTQGTVLRDSVRPSRLGGPAWAAQRGGQPWVLTPWAGGCRQSQAVGLGRGETPGCSPAPCCHSCVALGLPGGTAPHRGVSGAPVAAQARAPFGVVGPGRCGADTEPCGADSPCAHPSPTHGTEDSVLIHSLMIDGAAPVVGTCSSRAVAHQEAPGAGMSSLVLKLPHGTSSVLTCAGEQPQHCTWKGVDHPTCPPPPSPVPLPSVLRRCLLCPQHPTACPCPLLHTSLGPGEGLTMGRACWLLPRPHICGGKVGDKLEAGTPCHPAGPAQPCTGHISATRTPRCPQHGTEPMHSQGSPLGPHCPAAPGPSTAWHSTAWHGTAQRELTLCSLGCLQAVQPVLIRRSLTALRGAVPLILSQWLCGAGAHSARGPPSPRREQHRNTALVQRGQPGPRA